ncbi:hypothetical protein SAMN06265222_11426 [Neorhodopirellula lusitana]|uniref:Uncharacterized protein n=1 Tax=Neorhodopirellula lusitana TaxID=445327 RepID=A0ABY1QHS2_9BACT|nr:hypothetical protein SAMN06265222_11426 [Neorhodopirellula lusitana]
MAHLAITVQIIAFATSMVLVLACGVGAFRYQSERR